jgi:redox-sensitive bicupin YhaK (pirin superfamily)
VSLYSSTLQPGESVKYDLAPNRYAWVQVARGSADLNGLELQAGDGAAVEKESALQIAGKQKDTEVLLFDLA